MPKFQASRYAIAEGYMKVFISYSHEDERYLDSLKAHLAPLIRESSVELFTDRLLIPGNELNPEIEKALGSSDIFIFLVSSDFLNSSYCVEKELKAALDRHESETISLVSVVIRPCDWLSTSLSRFLALPKDGKPVSRWADSDEAFLNVVSELRRLILEREQSKLRMCSTEEKKQVAFSDEWNSYLSSTDIVYSNPRKSRIYLEDIFVSPHLLKISADDSEHIRTYTSIEEISSSIEETPYHLIIGKAQAGKTFLVKRLADVLRKDEFIPIVLNGPELGTTDVSRLLKKVLPRQYAKATDETFLDQKWSRCVFILDNFDEAKLNERHQERLVERLKGLGVSIVVFTSESILISDREHITEASGFDVCSIQDFGHVKRNELIKRWLEAGVEETIDEAELLRKRKQFETHVNSIIRNNLVPSRPVFLLSIIQSLETMAGGDFRLTSYGHCYNALIEKALRRGSIRVDEIDSFVNLLTNFAYRLFDAETLSVSLAEWDTFIAEYSNEYLVPSSPLDKLVSSGLLRIQSKKLQFSHKYIFYYYAGKHLSNLVEERKDIAPIEELCRNLHVEANANVLIFVTHHSRSKRIIEEIALYADEAFRKRSPAKLLAEETRYLAEKLQEIPDLLIESEDVEKAREDNASQKDRFREAEESEGEVSKEFDRNGNPDLKNTVFADISSSARTVEIIGQIVRNRHGSLSRSELDVLAESGMRCGLRFLDFFVELMRESEEGILEMVSRSVDAQKKPLTKAKRQRLAVSVYSHYSYGGIIAILMKTASSLGHERLLDILKKIEERHPEYVSIKLINAAILMEFSKDFPKEEIKRLYETIAGNVVAERILKHMVVSHLYLNYVDRQVKQWIAQQLKIPLSEQLRIEGKASQKRFARER